MVFLVPSQADAVVAYCLAKMCLGCRAELVWHRLGLPIRIARIWRPG